MLEYLSNNYTMVASITNIGTLVVWIFYAQLLFNSYRRQRLPRILINKGVGGEYLDSPCLICNMSQEPVFIYFMMVRLGTSEGVYTAPMTDREGEELPPSKDKLDLRSRTRQGPIHSGEFLEFVSFRRMIERTLHSATPEPKDGLPTAAGSSLEWLEVHVICIYGPERKPFGAVRRFTIEAADDEPKIRLYPATLDTQSRRSIRYRRKIDQWLKSYL